MCPLLVVRRWSSGRFSVLRLRRPFRTIVMLTGWRRARTVAGSLDCWNACRVRAPYLLPIPDVLHRRF